MKFNRTFLLFAFIISELVSSQIQENRKTEKLDSFFPKYLDFESDRPVANILVNLENRNFKYHKAFGVIDLESQIPCTPDLTFKTASITKIPTAVIILQLMEEGKIDLDKTAYHYLKENSFIDFDNLSLFDGKSYGKEITIRQLLKHESGLADIFTDTKEMLDFVVANPDIQWNPERLMGKYYEYGLNQKVFNLPGNGYHYTDVGYFLLGLCIENITETTLAEQYRIRIIEPLNLQNTYFEYYEKFEIKVKMAHAYYGDIDATKNINTSTDWAAGGWAATTEDLTTFIHALFQNKLFQNERTLKEMIEGNRYGMGIAIQHFKGSTYYGHFGFWGSCILYNPEKQITLCLSLNQVEPKFNTSKFLMKAIKILEK
ncbi:MAG: serine hydrolase domain-containing protein [Maribacter litoralis]|uniref:serine hydrolase domain-containing protein n=1 Tax=Maribacter litoralis TaxID=2059726 RepID=UPI0032999FD4